MLEKHFVQPIIRIASKRNAYGDFVPDPNGENETLYGRFRVIGESVRTTNQEELRSNQAMLWFAPGTNVALYDILYYESRYWLVMRVNEARKLGDTTIQFLKCWVEAHDMVS